jgi:hypothetical protein
VEANSTGGQGSRRAVERGSGGGGVHVHWGQKPARTEMGFRSV